MPPQMIAGERPISITRQHWLVLVPNVTGAFVLLIVGWFVIGLIPDEFLSHHVGGFRGLFDLALLLLLVGISVGGWMRWQAQNYMLTDHRIVVSRGVIARETESISLDRIQDIRVRQTLARRMVHCGDVEIDVAGRDGSEVLDFILEPQLFMNDVVTAVEDHRLGRYAAPPPTAVPGAPGIGYPGGQPQPQPGGFGGLLGTPGAQTAGGRFRRRGVTPPPMLGPRGPQRPPAGPPEQPFDPPPQGPPAAAHPPLPPPDDGGY